MPPTPLANIGLSTWPPLQHDHTKALRDIDGRRGAVRGLHLLVGRRAGPDHWLFASTCDHCPEHYAFLLSLETVRVAA